MQKRDEPRLITKEVMSFIYQLMKEYKEQKIKLSLVGKELFYKLEFLDEKVLLLESPEKENFSVFSPHTQEKKDNASTLYQQMKDIKSEIRKTEGEIEELEKRMEFLSTIIEKTTPVESGKDGNCDKSDYPYRDIGLYLLEIQEEDRQRISMDLHDSTVQTLTGMLHKIELTSRLIDMDTVRAKLELSTMSNTLKDVIDEMREIIFDLRPMPYDNISLISSIKKLINQLTENFDVDIFVNVEGEQPKDLDSVIKLTLLRVIDEAFTNAIKHSKADIIDLRIKFTKYKIKISIKDNGVGFDVNHKQKEASNKSSGFGLSIMKKRICLLSGKLQIQSHINEGTNILIDVPITEGKEEDYE